MFSAVKTLCLTAKTRGRQGTQRIPRLFSEEKLLSVICFTQWRAAPLCASLTLCLCVEKKFSLTFHAKPQRGKGAKKNPPHPPHPRHPRSYSFCTANPTPPSSTPPSQISHTPASPTPHPSISHRIRSHDCRHSE